jgi:hypothetical protein
MAVSPAIAPGVGAVAAEVGEAAAWFAAKGSPGAPGVRSAGIVAAPPDRLCSAFSAASSVCIDANSASSFSIRAVVSAGLLCADTAEAVANKSVEATSASRRLVMTDINSAPESPLAEPASYRLANKFSGRCCERC